MPKARILLYGPSQWNSWRISLQGKNFAVPGEILQFRWLGRNSLREFHWLGLFLGFFFFFFWKAKQVDFLPIEEFRLAQLEEIPWRKGISPGRDKLIFLCFLSNNIQNHRCVFFYGLQSEKLKIIFWKWRERGIKRKIIKYHFAYYSLYYIPFIIMFFLLKGFSLSFRIYLFLIDIINKIY